MQTKRFSPVALASILSGTLLSLMCGCVGDAVGRYGVVLSNERNPRQSVQVDVVAVNDTEYGQWRSYSMTDYWRPDDRLRRDAADYRRTFRFGLHQSAVQELKIEDAVWQKWESMGARHLFILADLGAFEDKMGENDPRRLILPLERRRWDDETIRIRVDSSGIRCLTPPNPEDD